MTAILGFGGGMAFEAGQRVGDYEVLGVLGRGGMGQVYRVRNLISDRFEAMKVILPDVAPDSDFAERFLREIKLHASLDHPNIAAMHTALRVNQQVLMIMELVEGVSVEEWLRRGRIAVQQALGCIRQVLDALSFAHSRGIIHRDVKPANIIVTPGGIVKLTDFGIARAPGERSLTLTGMALGSLHYMAPEQVRAEPADARSDVYSVGVTLYEMLTGERPIRGENEYAIMSAHLVKVPVPPLELVPGLSSRLSAAVMKALAKAPEERFQTAAQFRDALRAAEESGQVTAARAGGWDNQLLDRARQALTGYIGPIAAVIVKRAAARCQSPDELYQALAAEIPSERDRRRFLESLQR